MNLGHKESGFTLVGVMVTLGVVLLILTQIMFSQSSLNKVSKKMAASDGYNNSVAGFSDFLGRHLQQNFASICQGNTSVLQNLSFGGALAKYNNTLVIPTKLQGSAAGLAQRCRSPRFNADGQIYFCVDVSPGASFSEESFGGSRYGFAEVIVRPVDVFQNPLNCATFQAAPTREAGLQIYYRTYWAQKDAQGELKKRSGFYYAIKD